MTKVFRSVSEPIRTDLTWEAMCKDKDNGLIISWERGREMSVESPELAEKCLNGELPVLAWKGGVDKPIKGKKYGALHYLATWQGLRGDDLSIDTTQEIIMRCSKTNVEVVYTANLLTAEAEQESN
jgi:hypothetical protein